MQAAGGVKLQLFISKRFSFDADLEFGRDYIHMSPALVRMPLGLIGLFTMKSSMTLFGCEPKLAILWLPYIILSVIVMFMYPEFIDLKFLDIIYAKVVGFIWLGTGIIFWIYSAVFFLKYFKPGELITKGPLAFAGIPYITPL